MKTVRLASPFLRVKTSDEYSFGGDQTWCASRAMRHVGCGPVACTDVIQHLAGEGELMEKQEFLDLLRRVHRYMPIIPGFGIDGLRLALGINLYFLIHHMPYRARWGCLPKNLWSHLERMLDSDIPAVLSVGNNFPLIWGRRQVGFYEKCEGGYRRVTAARAHYVVATGMSRNWVEISSWGRRFYINKKEYETYVRRHSSWILSSLLIVRRIGGDRG